MGLLRRAVEAGGRRRRGGHDGGGGARAWGRSLPRAPPPLAVALLPAAGAGGLPEEEPVSGRPPGRGPGARPPQAASRHQGQAEEEVCKCAASCLLPVLSFSRCFILSGVINVQRAGSILTNQGLSPLIGLWRPFSSVEMWRQLSGRGCCLQQL